MTYLTQYLLFCSVWQTIISLQSFSNKFTCPFKAIPQGLLNQESGAVLIKLKILETELSSCGADGSELYHCKDKNKQTKSLALQKIMYTLHRNSCSIKISLFFTLNMILVHLLRELKEKKTIFKRDYSEATNFVSSFRILIHSMIYLFLWQNHQ